MAKTHLIIPELTEKDIARFWSKVTPPNENGCQLWMAGCDKDGYGRISISRKRYRPNYRAPRIAYFLYHGQEPGESLICHTCDVPACCAKAHLFLGTQKDNVHDAIRKNRVATGDKHWTRVHPERVARGERHSSRTHPERVPRGDKNGSRTHPERMPRGEQNNKAKLTEDEVRQIRALQGTGQWQGEVGAMFGVKPDAIGRIWHGKTWRHVI